jgi:hypothetical protein
MAEVVYVLCALTSIACAALLFRGYRRTRARLLLWSGLCFLALMVNNMMLFVDNVVFAGEVVPAVGPLMRSGVAVIGLALLLYGLIWETE